MKRASLQGTILAAAFALTPLTVGATVALPAIQVYVQRHELDAASTKGGLTVERDWNDDYGFVNHGEESFYLVRKGERRDPNLNTTLSKAALDAVVAAMPPGLPDEYVPMTKIVAGKIYDWDWSVFGPRKLALGDSPWALTNHTVVYPHNYSFARRDQAVAVYSDEFPWDFEFPLPHDYSFEALYQDQLITVRGTIHYDYPAWRKRMIVLAVALPTAMIIAILEVRQRLKRRKLK